MKQLKTNASLQEFQQYAKDMAKERGFQDETPKDIFVLLMEELGELAKAVRKSEGIAIDATSKFNDVDHELADVFIYVLHLANALNIDLEAAFVEKEAINNTRTWKKHK